MQFWTPLGSEALALATGSPGLFHVVSELFTTMGIQWWVKLSRNFSTWSSVEDVSKLVISQNGKYNHGQNTSIDTIYSSTSVNMNFMLGITKNCLYSFILHATGRLDHIHRKNIVDTLIGKYTFRCTLFKSGRYNSRRFRTNTPYLIFLQDNKS